MSDLPPAWWRDAVIYQIYPRSFADANGDGIGDLPGIRSRLPYLRDLGVDAVWLSPFYLSPQADAGYDVADYRTVDPIFGSVDDARGLVADAHELGLRVLVDLVPNHSSDRHDWFRQALAEGPGSPLRGRYHFRDGRGENGELPPNDWPSIFGGPAWTRVADGQWYLHLFAPEQPDLNWEHPAVADEFRTILRFWLDLGVDGFRIDVAHGLVKEKGLPDIGQETSWHLLDVGESPCFDRPGVHDIYRSWRTILDEYPGERIAVAEAWAPTLARVADYVRPDELHQAFNFSYMSTAWQVPAQRAMIDASLVANDAVGAPTTWTLSNHDVVRHTNRLMHDEQGDVAGKKPAAVDPAAGLRRARAASLLLLALPGSAYLYQGEELGLPEVIDLPPEVRQDPAFHRATGQDGYRDGCRVPIPWSDQEPPFGFTLNGARAAPWLPQPLSWRTLTVQAQTGDERSMLELYRRALRIRHEHPALGDGAMRWIGAPEGALAFARDPGFVCVVNMSADSAPGPRGAELLLSSGELAGDGGVPADTTAWFTTPGSA
jgi:alpha-glucosidase